MTQYTQPKHSTLVNMGIHFKYNLYIAAAQVYHVRAILYPGFHAILSDDIITVGRLSAGLPRLH